MAQREVPGCARTCSCCAGPCPPCTASLVGPRGASRGAPAAAVPPRGTAWHGARRSPRPLWAALPSSVQVRGSAECLGRELPYEGEKAAYPSDRMPHLLAHFWPLGLKISLRAVVQVQTFC